MLRELELDRPAGLFLDDRRAVAQSAADAQIVDLQAGEIAASQFAVDRQVEHCEIAPTRLYLKAGPDIPDFLRLEGAFLTDEAPFVPRRLPLVLVLVWGLDMKLTSLSDHSLPCSQLSAGLGYNARAALKLKPQIDNKLDGTLEALEGLPDMVD